MMLPGGRRIASAVLLLILPLAAAAHETAEPLSNTSEAVIGRMSINLIALASLVVAVLVAAASHLQQRTERQKQLIFWSIAVVTATTTLYLAVTTVRTNLHSATGGPVHWHADFRLFACGQELDLIDPKGLSNKVGTPVLHEHGDNRIHVEGVLVELSHGSLGRFFSVVGGHLDGEELTVPTSDGSPRTFRRGDRCPDGQPGEIQVFLYQTDGRLVTQRKLATPETYVLSPHERVPPGDCLIVEFGPAKERTDARCSFYEIGLNKGELVLEP